jgi:hypothetical protein
VSVGIARRRREEKHRDDQGGEGSLETHDELLTA